MSSFKLEKSVPLKKQLLSGGVFLALIGLVVAFLVSVPAGAAMVALGIIFAVGAAFASE